MKSPQQTPSLKGIATVEIIAPEVHEPACALDVTMQGISGDDFALYPEDYASFKLTKNAVLAQCGACALRVSIDTADDTGTAINRQPCLYK